MSNKVPLKEHQFKEGNAGGPGRPTMSDEEKALAKLTRTQFKVLLSDLLDKTKGEITQVNTDAKSKALDLMVSKVVLKAIENGDVDKINWFLEQLFGKLSENINVTTTHQEIMDKIRVANEKTARIIAARNV